MAIFGLFSLAAAAVIAKGIQMLPADESWGWLLIKWGAGLLVAFVVPLFLSAKMRANLSVSLVMVALTAFAFNLFLAYRTPPMVLKARELEAGRLKHPEFDHRSVLEVVRDMHADGVEAVPAMFGSHALVDHPPEGAVLPLAGISTSTTVLCNEGGEFSIYPSDEYGFNNPRNMPDEMDVVVVGDSYMQGQCVPPGKDLAGVLRARGYRAFTVGTGGNGPLLSLAALVEYGLKKKPKIVIWAFSGNDAGDLRAEVLSPVLRRYLEEPGYSQDLMHRQDEVDAFWRARLDKIRYLEPKPEEAKAKAKGWQAPKPKLTELVTLYSLRSLLGLRRGKQGDWTQTYRQVLVRARELVEAQDGKMYFMSLPYWELMENRRAPSHHQRVIDPIAKSAGLERVGFEEAVVAMQDDWPAAFPLRMAGHFSVEGYALMAQVIEEEVLVPNRIPKRWTTATSTKTE